jgi:N-acetylglucosamine PTS system EIICBA or EIICB component
LFFIISSESQSLHETTGFFNGLLGLFIYGVLNRLLLVTGLHHILNSLVWFVFGSYPGPDGKTVSGDLHRFFAGDPTAGSFMTGFFPIMMFGLPAACLAMYYAARPENRKLVGGMLMSMALTAFLTGVTEPVEFTFMFLAPILYVIHGILTGISMALMSFLGVRLGFTFSAGAFDYIISYRLGTNGWVLIPVGFAYFLIYYFLFSFAIRKFNLATPGRAEASLEPAAEGIPVTGGAADAAGAPAALAGAVGYVRALGGNRNLKLVDACTTRLRLEVADDSLVNEPALRTLGARGIVRPGRNALQVVIGPQAEILAGEIRDAMAKGEYAAIGPSVQAPAASGESAVGSISERPVQANVEDAEIAQRLVHAFGGSSNIQTAQHVAVTRLRFVLRDGRKADQEALQSAGAGSVIRASDNVWHVIAGQRAPSIAAALNLNLSAPSK